MFKRGLANVRKKNPWCRLLLIPHDRIFNGEVHLDKLCTTAISCDQLQGGVLLKPWHLVNFLVQWRQQLNGEF